MTSIVSNFSNLDIVCGARSDSVLYDLPSARIVKRGRLPKHGKKLSICDDFEPSDSKTGNYFIGYRKVLINIFGNLTIIAYVTAQSKIGNSRRLFLSTISVADLRISCAWQKRLLMKQVYLGDRLYAFIFVFIQEEHRSRLL